jgi:recombination protein RecT
MTDPELTAALERAAQPQDARNVQDLIYSMQPALERSLQSEAAAEILTRHYFNAIRYNPLLRQCTPESLVGALLLSAQVRLEPGPLGHVYLVPFRDNKRSTFEVTWMLGYTGIIELGRRGGAKGLTAEVVWDCDEYVQPWQNERGRHWTLKPGDVAERTERVGVLVTWKEDTERVALHCPPERIDTALAARKAKDKGVGSEDWYWRKTGVRFARPWLPLSTDLALASRADDGIVRGVEEDVGAAVAVVDEVDAIAEAAITGPEA